MWLPPLRCNWDVDVGWEAPQVFAGGQSVSFPLRYGFTELLLVRLRSLARHPMRWERSEWDSV